MRWPRYWSCGRWMDFLGWNFMAFRLAWSQKQVALKRDPTLAPTLAQHFMVQLGRPAVQPCLPSGAIARWKAGRAKARPYIGTHIGTTFHGTAWMARSPALLAFGGDSAVESRSR